MANIDHPYNDETPVSSGGNWVVNGSGMTPGGNPQDYYWANVTTLNPSHDYGMPTGGANQYGNTPGSTWSVSDITVTPGKSYFFFIWFEYNDPATGATTYRAYASYYNVLAQKKPIKRAIAAAAKRGSKKAKSGGKKSKKPIRPAKAKSGKKKSKKR
jgi:hypothetical protein